MKGPAIFLAQFLPPLGETITLQDMCKWAASLGYEGVQVPTWDKRIFDLELASESQDYCEEVMWICREAGVQISELSTHLQGQVVAAHPAYLEALNPLCPEHLADDMGAQREWGKQQLVCAAKASQRLGLTAHATFSGALLWHRVYPWPQRSDVLVAEAFAALAELWTPILDEFASAGVDLCFELHPGEDLHDGITFDRFLAAVNDHPRASILYDPSHFLLQQLDYIGFIDHYHDRIKAFHVKDAEFRPSAKAGLYGGYASWIDRPGRFSSLGDGQIDFKAIFSKFAQYGFDGWAVLEWECCLKHPDQGAEEGAPFIRNHFIKTTDRRFDDFSAGSSPQT
jgi:sugar phosphate isomerase/epimerase